MPRYAVPATLAVAIIFVAITQGLTLASVTGSIELPKDKEMVMPGDNVSITVMLINPIAMEEGLRVAIREGGRTVGAGVVAKIIE